jgi:hypothetical protein
LSWSLVLFLFLCPWLRKKYQKIKVKKQKFDSY